MRSSRSRSRSKLPHRSWRGSSPSARPIATLTPAHLAALPEEDLRAVGCSRAKAIYLKDLSARIVEGSLDLAALSQLPDEEIIAQLVAVKGIGRWTAEMFLIFSLGRLDVWPVDDLGIVIAAQGLYAAPGATEAQRIRALGEPLRPYRTLAAWYLWQNRRLPPRNALVNSTHNQQRSWRPLPAAGERCCAPPFVGERWIRLEYMD